MKIGESIIHCCIDIETLGLQTTCEILEVAAVVFSVSERTGVTIHKEFVESCNVDLTKAEPETLAWWRSTHYLSESLDYMLDNSSRTFAVTPETAADNLARFIASQHVEFLWAQGKDFDFPILRSHLPTFDEISNVPYANVHCARDLGKLAVFAGNKRHSPKPAKPHRALYDARATASSISHNLLALKGR